MAQTQERENLEGVGYAERAAPGIYEHVAYLDNPTHKYTQTFVKITS